MISHFATKQEVLPRLVKLEQDVEVLKQDVAEFKSETLTRFDKVFRMLETLNQERLFMHDALIRIEEKLLFFYMSNFFVLPIH